MIDGIKCMDLPVDLVAFIHNPLINLHGRHSIPTGEVKDYCLSNKFRDLLFMVKSNRSSLNGSLHKYYKGFNYDDFSYSQIGDAVKSLASLLQLNPNEIPLNNLELGINIQLPYSPEKFMDAIINHKGSLFAHMTKSIFRKEESHYINKLNKCYSTRTVYVTRKEQVYFTKKIHDSFRINQQYSLTPQT